MVHIATIASKRNSASARRSLEQLLDGLEYQHPAEPTEALSGTISAEPEFEADLPEGWRKPVPAETAAVRDLAAKTGQSNVDGEKCWVAIRPQPLGDPDLMLFCKAHWFLDPIDTYSWKGVERQVHERFFGKSPEPVEAAEEATVGDRMGFLYRPPANDRALRLALASFDKGVIVGWGLAQSERDEALHASFVETLKGTRFTGPDGGAPIHGGVHLINYWTSYRRSSPIVWGPVLLLLGAVIFGLKRLKQSNATFDEDDGFIDETEEIAP